MRSRHLAPLLLLSACTQGDLGPSSAGDDVRVDGNTADGSPADGSPADGSVNDGSTHDGNRHDGGNDGGYDGSHGDPRGPETDPADNSLPPDDLPTTSEFLLFDGTGRQFTYDDNGFHNLISPGDTLEVPNWSTPVDYYEGEFHIRYLITGPSDQAAGRLQTCIWTMGNDDGDGRNYFPESCSGQASHTGVGEYFNNQLVPSTWWQLDNEPLIFAHPERFLIRVVLRGTSGCNVTRYSVSNPCWDEWPTYENMVFRVTMVMVGPDDTFSGWQNYP